MRLKNTRTTTIRIIVSVLVVLLFLSVLQWFFPQLFSFVRELFWRSASPGRSIVTTYEVKDYEALQQENELLKKTLTTSIFDFVELERLRQENTELRSMLSFATTTNPSLVAAHILGEVTIDSTTLFVIDRGTRDDIVPGMPVVVDDGVLIGLVSEVDFTSAFVVPIEENTATLSARLLNKEGRIHGVVEGIPGVATRLNLIPKDIEISKSDIVVTSGLDTHIPKDLIIGVIDNTLPTPNDFFQTASLDFIADYKDYEVVSIAIP
ncbi:MAG: rod shape-determining protein MreC [Patescibacteria group bacterium]